MLTEDFSRLVIAERRQQFEQRARQQRETAAPLAASAESVVLRLCRVDDDPALELLAALSGGKVATGRYVLAEVDGAIVVGMPLSGGEVISDPFRKTAHLVPLLEMRARQLTRPARTGSLLTRLIPVRH